MAQAASVQPTHIAAHFTLNGETINCYLPATHDTTVCPRGGNTQQCIAYWNGRRAFGGCWISPTLDQGGRFSTIKYSDDGEAEVPRLTKKFTVGHIPNARFEPDEEMTDLSDQLSSDNKDEALATLRTHNYTDVRPAGNDVWVYFRRMRVAPRSFGLYAYHGVPHYNHVLTAMALGRFVSVQHLDGYRWSRVLAPRG